MSRPGAATRITIALLAVFLYAAPSTVRWARRASRWPTGVGRDAVSTYEHRFERLRVALPATGVVGYQGHPDPAARAPADGPSPALVHFQRYLLAQYSLAPLLLVENTTPEFVIGNYEPGAEPPPPAGFHQAAAFGDGLVLFRRTEP